MSITDNAEGRETRTSGAWRFVLFAAIFFSAIVSFIFLGPPSSPKAGFPALTGRVVDEALLLRPTAYYTLDNALTQFEQQTGHQLVFVSVTSLSGLSIEQYGVELGRLWGIGSKSNNDGILLIVAPHEHKVRIEVGYGLEAVLTDAQCNHIIQNIILPEFRKQQFERGILSGVQGIIKVLTGEAPDIPSSPTVSNAERQRSNQRVDFDWIDIGLIVSIILFLTIATVWYRRALRKTHADEKKGDDDDFSSSGGGFGGGSGGFGGGGGFSGGGGSFGGGGSSGSW